MWRSLLIRIPIAAIFGGLLWFVETLPTYYADLFSVIFAGLFGVVVSGFVALVIAVFFLPVLYMPVWAFWRRIAWFPVVLFVVGVACAVIARQPSMLQQGLDPEFGAQVVHMAHAGFGSAAWLIMIGSVVVAPFGFSSTNRWF